MTLYARVLGGQRDNPGPGAYKESKLSAYKERSPEFTIKSRHEIKSNVDDVPYRNVRSSVGDGPKHSLSSRHAVKDKEETPGPNYVPQQFGSDARKSKVSSRYSQGDDPRRHNPGPGAYSISPKFGNEGSKYTLHGRTKMPGEDTVSPGPAAYNQDDKAIRRRAPSSSMHVRPKDSQREVTPGPSDYNVKRDLGGPSSTLHGRPSESTKEGTPGPGQYSPTRADLQSSPKYTMKGRHDTKENVIDAPYRDLPSTVGQGPKISMSSRHKTRDIEETPGPNYVPQQFGSDARKSKVSSRYGSDNDPYKNNPGPGAYSISPKFGNEGSKYTLHGRTKMPGEDTVSPGPAAYNQDDKAIRRRAPSSSMHVRPKDSQREVTPGPSDYNVKRDLGGPSSTLHGRPSESTKEGTPGPGQYSPTRADLQSSPKYTMKGRHDTKENVIDAPYRDLPSTVGQGPKISMSSRHKTRDIEETPGPNYVPQQFGSDARKSKVSSRYGSDNDPYKNNPGPGAYSISPKFGNEGSKYTLHGRTKMPGEDTVSPGPAAYNQDDRAIRKSSPKASMHVRPKDSQREVTPGPSDYNVKRDLGGPSSTLHGRPSESTKEGTPGPGQYSPTRADLQSSPKYTMKGRHDTKENVIDAPYRDLPSTVGQGPKISMSSRHKTRDIEETPGPNYVPQQFGSDARKSKVSSRYGSDNDPYKNNPGPGAYSISPKFGNEGSKYTLHGRTKMPGEDTVSPGPAAYNQDDKAIRRRAPSSSMHVRPKDSQREVTPGPSDYNVKRDLGGPSSTLHGRPSESTKEGTPGPGQYSPTRADLQSSPKYTMKGRHDTKENVIDAPYRDLPSTVGQGPKISMSSRHKTRDIEETPGPNYVPQQFGSDARKSKVSSRYGSDNDPYKNNPGPGAYSISPKFGNEGSKYTLHGRTKMPGEDTVSPGPAAYNQDDRAIRKSSPKASMHVRPKDSQREVTPGPSDYNVKRDLGGPSSTLHGRPSESTKEGTPGPGQYSPTRADLQSSPKYTMKGRHDTKENVIDAPYRDLPSTVGQGPKISMSSRHKTRDIEETPGPNYVPQQFGSDARKSKVSSRYGSDNDPYKNNPGPGAYSISPKFGNEGSKYTLHGRTKMPGEDTVSPGPAAYNQDDRAIRKSSPKASMHVRPKDSQREVTPGPSDYNVKRDLGGPSSTLHGRPSESTKEGTPGPGQYSPTRADLQSSPKYTMKGRHDTKENVIDAPYRDLPSTVGQGPKISMSSRHKTRDIEETPGPNYVPQQFGSDARKSKVSSRYGSDNDPYKNNPGPGAYSISPKFGNEGSKYTLHGRTKMPGEDTVSPGPAAYNQDDRAIRKSSPKASMHIRTKQKGPEETPGYVNLGSALGGPAYTIGLREDLDLIPM